MILLTEVPRAVRSRDTESGTVVAGPGEGERGRSVPEGEFLCGKVEMVGGDSGTQRE